MFMNLGLGRLSPAAEARMTTPNYYTKPNNRSLGPTE
jgi:hypothetical protein